MNTVLEVKRDSNVMPSLKQSDFCDSDRRSSVDPKQSQDGLLDISSQAQSNEKDTVVASSSFGNEKHLAGHTDPSNSEVYSDTAVEHGNATKSTPVARYYYPSLAAINGGRSGSSDSSENSESDTDSVTRTSGKYTSSMPASDLHETRTSPSNRKRALSPSLSSDHTRKSSKTMRAKRDTRLPTCPSSHQTGGESNSQGRVYYFDTDPSSDESYTIEDSSDDTNPSSDESYTIEDSSDRESFTIDDTGSFLVRKPLFNFVCDGMTVPVWRRGDDEITGRVPQITITWNHDSRSMSRDTSPPSSFNISVNYSKSSRQGGTTKRRSYERRSWR